MTVFVSDAQIVASAEAKRDTTSSDERALRRKNRLANALLLAQTELYHGIKADCEAAERKGWMDAAAFLEREGDQHGANLLRAEKGPQG